MLELVKVFSVGIVTGKAIAHFENLHGRRNNELALDLDPPVHVVVVLVGVLLKLSTLLEITHFGLAGNHSSIIRRAVVNDKLLALLVENREVNLLVAEQRQLHRLFYKALLALAVGHVAAIVILYFLERMDFPLAHLKKSFLFMIK